MARGPLKVYEYAGCSTCRKALAFLDKHGLAYRKVPIVETPPTREELERMASAAGSLRKLFNTSGQLYRELGLGARLPGLTDEEAYALLARHGKLVKRPFLLGPGVALVGFKEEAWKAALL